MWKYTHTTSLCMWKTQPRFVCENTHTQPRFVCENTHTHNLALYVKIHTPLLTRATLWGFFCMSLWVYICVSNFTYKRALWGYIYVQRYIVGVLWYSHKKIPNLIQNLYNYILRVGSIPPHKALLNALEYISILGVLPQCRKHPQCSCMMKFTPTMYLL